MIDKEFVKEKINLITRDLVRLKIFSGMSFSDVSKDFMKYSALKNIMMETIGRAIDINEHLISELSASETDAPKDYKQTFLFLGKMNVLPNDFAAEVAKSAGFRNAIVHEYNNLDKEIVYKSIDDAINQYAKYCQYILDFLDKK